MSNFPRTTLQRCWRGRTFPLVVGIYVVGMLLAGCARPAVAISFETLCGISADQMGGMEETDVEQWIKDRYTAAPFRDQRSYEGDAIVIFWWSDHNAIVINGHLAALSVPNSGITFDQVVNSLGLPAAVSTYREGSDEAIYGSLWLHYPQEGLLLGSVELVQATTAEVRVTRDSQVTVVHCLAPGALESLQRIGFYRPDLAVPWPGFGAAVPLHMP